METWTKRRGANGSLDTGRPLDALEQARRERPDLVLTDVTMPVIFLRGEVGQANAQRARALGAVAYLAKPFDLRALAAFVAHELAAARAGPVQPMASVAS